MASQSDRETLIAWLVEAGLRGSTREALIEGYCARLVSSGIPLMRLHIAQGAFHPRYGGVGFDWVKGESITRHRYEYSQVPTEAWQQSPLVTMLVSGQEELREDLRNPQSRAKFELFQELHEMGGKDYFATSLLMEDTELSLPVDPNFLPEGFMISWTSDAPEGFSEAQLEMLRAAQPHLGLALKSASNRQVGQELLSVYLGADAGDRVFSGELQRGSLQEIDAVIGFFDLSGFTSMSERLDPQVMIDMLNDYFEIAARAIHERGGHILKFMGDGILLMFDTPKAHDEADAALDCVAELRQAIQLRNVARVEAGLPVSEFNYALNAGRLLYGNIGADSRLDFTAIGPSVNHTARLSGMHGSLGRDVIVAKPVADAATRGRHDLVSLGRYMLRGVAEPMELFTLYAGKP
ncbi:adenylate/guanylate cyclase domain-containing protein [Shimia abyssi]|uniref:Adenylate/guanylate cyclase n=1 Tax=Shimia abyssi TaxID=1662395 RepID=A0A2P8FKT0_9RHOB|nr:adenylate/guanylate cyclase domain-containing protein [Shimia abyssi]PSL22308.1 adenylate/guanylate cyclase [Shimia abyssi]